MDTSLNIQRQEADKRKGIVVSVTVHVLLLLFCLLPFISEVKAPVQQLSGILVTFGTPDGGNSSEVLATPTEEPSEEEASTSAEKVEKVEPSKAPEPEPVEKTPKKEEPTPVEVEKETLTEESNRPIVKKVDKKAEEKKAAEEKAEAERLQREAEAKAREEARKKAEAEEAAKKAKADAAKKQYSGLFGSGRGENNNTGNQGQQDGDPNSDNLKGLAKGSSRVGGGLSDRGVLFEPSISDNTQKVGKVVIKVCVDETGKVVEASFTQRGSTTTDTYLVDKAKKAAQKYKFTKSDVETQCGTITVDFKVGK